MSDSLVLQHEGRVFGLAFSPNGISIACELAQDVVMKFRPKAEELGVSLGSSLGYDLPMVNADIGMMERVLSNLIDNALRYTPSGGTVEVDGRTDNGRVRLTVRDTGQGIPPQDIPKITERFYKARGVTPRASGGTGLGLAIVTRVLELHNSKLQIDSTPGEGTAVSFELETSE